MNIQRAGLGVKYDYVIFIYDIFMTYSTEKHNSIQFGDEFIMTEFLG